MPLTVSLTVLVAITALVVGLVVLVVGVLLAWRDSMRRTDELFQGLVSGLQPTMRAHAGELNAMLAAHEDKRQAEHDRLRDDMSAMRADLEWLAGERMIEQAIQMCRDGQSNTEVSRETGLSQESVRTLSMLRAH